MDQIDAEHLEWATLSVARLWPNARIAGVVTLKSDASTRRFFRFALESSRKGAPPTVILVDLGPDDLPRYARALNLLPEPLDEPPWLNVHRFLTALGAPVPALYCFSPAERAMLVEDVGNVSLYDAARAEPARAGDLYRLAVRHLLDLHVRGTRKLRAGCIASAIAYDERLFGWEMNEFVEFGCDAVAGGIDRAALGPELTDLARRLGKLPRVFSHRDYHGQNLFIQQLDGPLRLRILDFQDALMAPAAQDLAVLLTTRDTATVVTPALERRLLEYYQAGLVRRGAPGLEPAAFLSTYRLCVLQHALKVIGRFTWLEREGKRGYARYIPDALAQARRILAGPEGDWFVRLRAALLRDGGAG
ncbi:MAG TPA: phosphotransferase [Candidatus Binataceae bacterium]|nr:phosphotransferase [Candidatus Binataceae bacterium]